LEVVSLLVFDFEVAGEFSALLKVDVSPPDPSSLADFSKPFSTRFEFDCVAGGDFGSLSAFGS
jgi:hypothetical protein